MKRVRHLLAGAAVAATMVAATAFAIGTANAESNGGVRVMPLGDSITDGFNVPGGYRVDLWQKVVTGGYRVDFVGSQFNGPASLGDHDHEGHSGWTIAQVDANVVNWLRTTTPRTVLLHIGTNDIYGSDPAGAPTRLATLVDRIIATSPDTNLFVSTIIPLGFSDATVRTFNAAIPGIVRTRASAGKRVYLVDMYNALTTADLADGVHPNAGGYSKMATAWYNALRSVPGSLDSTTPTTPPTSAPPTTAPPTTPPTLTPPTTPPPTSGGPAGCTGAYRVVSTWSNGFQAEVTVRNGGTATLNGWTVRMTLAGGQTITSLWNGVNTGSSGAVSVRNAAYNGTVPANGTTTFGFTASGDGAAAPSGVTCSSP